MREIAAYLVLATFGGHTSVLSTFPPPSSAVERSRSAASDFAPLAGPVGPTPVAAPDETPQETGSSEVDPPVDLRTWTAEGEGGSGAWRVTGRSALSLGPQGIAYLVSPDDHLQARFEGTVRWPDPAAPQLKDAATGFVLGYRAPLSAREHGPSQREHLLLAWQPVTEPDGEVLGEWTLSRITSRRPTPEILAQVSGSSTAFALQAERAFSIEYARDRIRLRVGGDEVLDVPGVFPAGRFGLYSSGASGARFSGLVREAIEEDAPAPSFPMPLDGPAPAVGMTLNKVKLTPHDHTMRDVGLSVYATDPSGELPTVEVRVYADEPDDEDPSDGNLWPDSKLDEASLWLRAERRSSGDGRVYLILAEAQGSTGSAHDCASVVVPLTNTTAGNNAVNAQAAAAVAHCEANGNAPAGFFLLAQGPYSVKEPSLAVRPILECVVENGPGNFTAVFGYKNDNPLVIEIPVGPDNKFTQAPLDRGQPTRFAPGRSPSTEGAFTVPFNGSNLTWSVRGPDRNRRNATASSNSVRCTFAPATPVAVDDTATTAVDTPVVIPVLLNDSDPQGQPLHVMRVVPPATGAVEVNSDGTVTFTPSPGFVGVSVFTYVASDGVFGSDVATVTVTVSDQPVNQPPSVDAGPDQAITLPATAALQGTVADDGLPSGGSLTVLWSKDSGPGTVSFAPPDSVTSTASFSAPGTYVLRLTASDSELAAFDTVTVVVSAPAAPSLSIADVTVDEGHVGLVDALVTVSLSPAAAGPVTVTYLTNDQTARSGCDYVATAGLLTFAPGVTSIQVTVPIVGELAEEPDEILTVSLFGATGATIADEQGLVTIVNDDTANTPPSSPGQRTPAHGVVGIPDDPTLGWESQDPDGDPLTYDVYLGTALDLTGLTWQRHCPATTAPAPRYGAASAYDDVNDRLVVFGGQTASGEVADVWVLANATGLGGAPRWTQLAPPAGPAARQRAAAVYDAASNRLIVVGGCSGGCTSVLTDAWALSNANGVSGVPAWTSLPDMPAARFGQAAALDASGGRLMAFGGSTGTAVTSSFWLLHLGGTPAWQDLGPAVGPSAREGASAAFDAVGTRLYVFGGRDHAGAVSNEAWLLDDPQQPGSTWTLVPVDGVAPAARWGHASSYDETTRRLVVFHGTGAGLESNTNIAARDAYVLEEIDPATSLHRWARLETDGAPAPGRFLAASAYSPSRARLVVAGGRDNRAAAQWLDDVWTLTDPVGHVPLVAQDQSGPSFVAPTSDQAATYFWRVVARDPHGATNGAALWTFRPNAPPVVDAGPDRQVTLPQTLLVEGVVTDDGRPAPPSLTITWTANDPGVTFSSEATASTTVSFAAGGQYVLTLTASDGAATTSDSLVVQVVDPNHAPVVDAGPDLVTTLARPRTGGVIVNHDEWTLSNDGFFQVPDARRFVLNVAAWMSGGQPGKFLAYSNDFGLTGSTLANTMTGAGHQWTVSLTVPFTLENLLQYDGVFLSNNAINAAVLTEYVRAGGSVYVAGGTFGGPPNLFNGFLGAFGMAYEGPFNGVGGTIPITAQHPVFAGVPRLYFNNGNYVLRTANAPANTALFHATNGRALFGIYTHGDTLPMVPATATLAGTATDDGLPAPPSLTTTWSQASGPAPSVIANPSALSTAVSFDTGGTYVFTLAATDGALTAQDSKTVTVVPENAPPFAYAGVDQDVPLGPVALSGVATDADGLPGGVVQVGWSVTSGPAPVSFAPASSLSTVAGFTASGTYVLRLTASDTDLIARDEVTVVVRARADLTVAAPDLATFVVDGQTLQAAGQLAATVTNSGAGAAPQPFEVTFFDDRNHSGRFETGIDVVLGVGTVPGLPAGQAAVVTATASGEVLFAGSPVHVWVDSGETVPETVETNNFASTLECETPPAPAPFTPTLKWSWTGSTVEPGSRSVMSAPGVGDINADGWPDVVFPTYQGSSDGVTSLNNRLRAVDGRTGAELFTVTHPVDNVAGTSQVALGNIDDDPFLEIVGLHTSNTRVIAFEHDGALKWISPPVENNRWGGVSLADLDGDGYPEVVVGRQVLNRDGTLRWTGTGGRGDGPGFGALSLVADVNLDGLPDVVAGNTVYRSHGAILWQNTLPDGFNAVGNFDADAFPEIVHVEGGRVRLLDHTGAVVWGPVTIPFGGRGGPPTVADMNGDGTPEIGVAGASRYAVFRANGTLLWSAVIQDATSNVTGSSVFDFEGDGSVEVVYADEVNLRVYRGSDGAVLFERAIGSCTAYEYPVVADVDGDGSADLVVTSNFTSGCPTPVNNGVFVFSSPNWVGTRRLWNQHTYHVTNVHDDGTIPRVEQPSWLTYNSYRQNRLTQGCAFARPDLVPSFVRRSDGPGTITFTARIGNAGGRTVGSGVSVSFYDREPATGTLLGTVATTGPIAPGAFVEVPLTVPDTIQALPLWVVADDPATVGESDETNNAYDSHQFVNAPPNTAPTVSAGPDQRLVHPQVSTLLDGTAADDGLPLGDLTTTWTVRSGPGAVTLGDAGDVDTTAAFGAPGTYVLRLTADDGELLASDELTIVVEPANQAPVVNAGPDRTTTALVTAIDATVTDDGLPTGAAVGVQWTQVSGPQPVTFGSPDAVDTTVTVTEIGTYVLRLSASDTALTTTDDVQLEVTAFTNNAPIVDAGPDRSLTLPQNSLTLTGSAIDDGLPVGSTLTFAWSQVSGPTDVAIATPAAAATAVTFPNPGSYVLRLRASDGALTGLDDVSVTVQAAPPSGPPPSAALTSPAAGTRITGPVPVVGSALSDSLASWQLEHRVKGDGPWTRFASGATQVTNGTLGMLDATMLLNGMTEVRLTVTDTAGRFASVTTHVVVKEQQKVGNFTVSFVDLEVPVAGLPIRVTRSYDSRDKRPGDFGFGWRLDLSDVRVEESDTAGLGWQASVVPGPFASYCLDSARPPVVTLTLPDGRVLDFQMRLTPSCQTFVPIQDARVSYVPIGTTLGTLTPASGADVYVFASWPGAAELVDAADFSIFDPSLYRYTSPDGRVFLVHDTQGLKSLTDLNGNVLTVGPNGITHSSGKGIAFTRVGGRITKITDPSGIAIDYGYDGNGDLASHTDREDNTTRFGYHEDFPHHLVSIEDPLGRRPIRNEYDDDGRLVRHIDAFGKTIEYTHQIGIRREIVTDRNLKQRVLDYDARGNVLQETDPLGKVVLRTFDARNNRLTETLPHDPGTPNPPTTTYTYDGADNVLSVTDPENNRTEYTYNARKQVLTVKDPRGHFTTNVYDTKGNLTSTRISATAGGPALTETTSTYDTKGSLRTQTVRVDGVPQTTSYGYDTFGSVTHETDATGHLMTYGYDTNGNRTRQTTTRTLPGGATETLETRYEYDSNGRLLRTIDPDGTSTRSVYDPLGRAIESYDKLDHRTSSTYDEMGRLKRTTFADTTFEESTYDDEGRRLSLRDRRAKVTTYEYDDTGRLKKTTFPDTNFTENTYDPAGRLTAVRDARGKTTTYEYDRAGRRTKVTVPIATGVSAETVFTYDANGNQLTVRDPLLRTTTFEYDVLNRRTKTIFHDTSYTETTYDELGRRRTERDQAGRVTGFAYDALSRLTSVTDARGKVTSYGYDEMGSRIRQTDANLHVTAFEYDRLGRETRRTLPAVGGSAAFETKTYDDAGNLESRTDFAGRITTYTYDVMNRLLSRTAQCGTPPCAGAADASFTYTESGRRETVTDARGVTSYDYDDRDRLSSLTYPDGRVLGFLHDGNGNRTTLTATIPAIGGGAPTVLTTTYTYDDANRLDLVTDTAGRVYDHGYDLNGNRTSLAQPNGTLTSYVYNTLNRLTNLSTVRTGSGTVVHSYALTLGPAGNRERIEEMDGTVRVYGYDELYRLTGDTVTIGALNQYTKGFVYDDVGNRQTQTTTIGPAGSPGPNLTAGTVASVHDERDRLTTETLDANPSTTYGWDADGNLVTKSAEATYTWDRENRLTRVAKTDGLVVDHTYDADGARVRTVTTPSGGPASTTDFLVDTSGSLSHVVAETNGQGLIVHYVRGDDLLSLMRQPAALVPPAEWPSRYYHADHIGSVRRLTDESGAITDGYTYTAFGELLGHSGTDPQPYAFTGEPYDPNVGLQYHRARWMDARVGRFVGIDPVRGTDTDPFSLHRYLYASAGPTDKTDPTGLYTYSQTTTALTGANTLRATSVVSYRASVAAVKLKLAMSGVIAVGVGVELLTAAAIKLMLEEDEQTKGPRMYRGMKQAGLFPEIGPTARTLGARPGMPGGDIPVINGEVEPLTGGMSVDLVSPFNIIDFRRSRSLGGTSPDPTWAMPIALVPPGLMLTPATRPDNPFHAYVEPAFRMSEPAYQALLASTAPLWEKIAE